MTRRLDNSATPPVRKSRQPDAGELRQTALRMLARRALTRRELRERLLKRGGSRGDVNAVVQDCLKAGYIDEAAIAEDHVRRARMVRLVGRFLTAFELKQRGVPEDLTEAALDREYPEAVETEVCLKFAGRKWSASADLPREKRCRRVGGALNRRGFSAENIGRVMRELESNPPTPE